MDQSVNTRNIFTEKKIPLTVERSMGANEHPVCFLSVLQLLVVERESLGQ